jgi:hypothetical protein
MPGVEEAPRQLVHRGDGRIITRRSGCAKTPPRKRHELYPAGDAAAEHAASPECQRAASRGSLGHGVQPAVRIAPRAHLLQVCPQPAAAPESGRVGAQFETVAGARREGLRLAHQRASGLDRSGAQRAALAVSPCAVVAKAWLTGSALRVATGSARGVRRARKAGNTAVLRVRPQGGRRRCASPSPPPAATRSAPLCAPCRCPAPHAAAAVRLLSVSTRRMRRMGTVG